MAYDKPSLKPSCERSLLKSPFQMCIHSKISADPSSQPDAIWRMLSRSPRERLDTAEARENNSWLYMLIMGNGILLRLFHSHSPWMTSNEQPSEYPKQERFRLFTVLNPRIRVENGLPILNMDAEMRHYEIPDHTTSQTNITKPNTSVYGNLQKRRLLGIGNGRIY
ncbi:hypothetical protein AJ78_06163 [Emergomyces pasteurianus Ep9510]|uniref:Uncharacterized protein n=1 Tax=Emergomyces pasteurianus Ep9510 TaxID=1447872 RepID=A0A1J9PBG3_9EURO|nr:hypothetical protein AJ78_06163 [Emergomyces pasteurianus Ep9510]